MCYNFLYENMYLNEILLFVDFSESHANVQELWHTMSTMSTMTHFSFSLLVGTFELMERLWKGMLPWFQKEVVTPTLLHSRVSTKFLISSEKKKYDVT